MPTTTATNGYHSATTSQRMNQLRVLIQSAKRPIIGRRQALRAP